MNCMICGLEVKEKKGYKANYSCNGAVLGAYIEIRGHKTCVDNVDNRVVTPNRLRLSLLNRK